MEYVKTNIISKFGELYISLDTRLLKSIYLKVVITTYLRTIVNIVTPS